MISKEQIESVVNTADIVDVIGERIDLRRSGANHKANCPFHDEKTASFMVSHAKQIFKCFGCGVAGDVIKFIMLYENISYPDAIRMLAGRYGIEIKESFNYQDHNKSDDDKKETMRRAMELAAEFYHQNLIAEIKNENSSFTEYIRSRDISEEDIKLFKLGYAPDKWNALKENDPFKNIDDKLLIEIGLRKQNEKGNVYDLFRNRLMFPVFDVLGNVIAFSARTLDDEVQPKYVNSPESIIYKKSKVFFGFYQSKDTIRKKRSMILVEGNMDMVSMFKNGFTNTVALCGTAFTEDHAQIMKRNADKINILFDGDPAGIKAAAKTSEILLAAGVDNTITMLPPEEDPDTYAKKYGNSELQNLIDGAMNLIDFKLKVLGSVKKVDAKIIASKSIIESLKMINDELILEQYIKEASEKLNIEGYLIRNALKKGNKPRSVSTVKPERSDKYIYNRSDILEFNIIYLMLSNTKVCTEFLKRIDESYFLNHETAKLYLRFFELYEEGEAININNILVDFDDKFKDFFIDYTASQESVFLADVNEDDDKSFEEKIYHAYRDSYIKIKKRQIKKDIKQRKDELKFTSELSEQDRLMNEINDLKKQEMEIENNL
ncbi:MAG: DNA primase [Candidatus Delongbacteria bacterium]|nr:DNA primase [Candidatus Delongbacteria bacterium]